MEFSWNVFHGNAVQYKTMTFKLQDRLRGSQSSVGPLLRSFSTNAEMMTHIKTEKRKIINIG